MYPRSGQPEDTTKRRRVSGYHQPPPPPIIASSSASHIQPSQDPYHHYHHEHPHQQQQRSLPSRAYDNPQLAEYAARHRQAEATSPTSMSYFHKTRDGSMSTASRQQRTPPSLTPLQHNHHHADDQVGHDLPPIPPKIPRDQYRHSPSQHHQQEQQEVHPGEYYVTHTQNEANGTTIPSSRVYTASGANGEGAKKKYEKHFGKKVDFATPSMNEGMVPGPAPPRYESSTDEEPVVAVGMSGRNRYPQPPFSHSHHPSLQRRRNSEKEREQVEIEVWAEKEPSRARPSGRQTRSMPVEPRRDERADMIKLDAMEEELTCPVCMSLIVAAHAVSPCGHVGCFGCQTEWMQSNQSCAICRKPVTTSVPLIPLHAMDSLIEKFVTAKGRNWDGLQDRQERKDAWEAQRVVIREDEAAAAAARAASVPRTSSGVGSGHTRFPSLPVPMLLDGEDEYRLREELGFGDGHRTILIRDPFRNHADEALYPFASERSRLPDSAFAEMLSVIEAMRAPEPTGRHHRASSPPLRHMLRGSRWGPHWVRTDGSPEGPWDERGREGGGVGRLDDLEDGVARLFARMRR